MAKVGFTGTRRGMTEAQIREFRRLLSVPIEEFHHGDCIGADIDAHTIARERGLRIVCHPPKDPKLRAFCFADVQWPVKDYLVRNHDIVDATDQMIATPGEMTEPASLRGKGTWATIRYARSVGKQVYVILPDGRVTR